MNERLLAGRADLNGFRQHGGQVFLFENRRVDQTENIACGKHRIAKFVVIAPVGEALVHHHAQRRGGEEAVGMKIRRSDAFEHEMNFEKNCTGLVGLPDTEDRVAGFHPKNRLDRGANQRVILAQKTQILP